ncbi:hypothetical protein ZTR_02332 [Talaromyces verruculosus]|nr:hypothetical protein ZTR_02332 [Talaromyces verruculosus]
MEIQLGSTLYFTLCFGTYRHSNDNQIPSTTEAAIVKDKVRLRTQLVVILFVCVFYFDMYVCLVPEVSIREDIICKTYYDRLDNDEGLIAERDCAVDAVQRELGLLNQVYITISELPGLLLVFPYGALADRIGRRKVLLCSVVGIALCDAFKLLVMWQPNHFLPRAIWLAPLFKLIGGGDAVAATVVLATLADVYTGQDRTTVFARVASLGTACEIFAPLLGSILMLKNSWMAVLLGFGMFLVGASVTLALLPETLAQRPLSADALDARAILNTRAPSKLRYLGDQITAILTVFRESLAALFATKNVGLLLFCFFAATVGTVAAIFEVQYAHKRFGWSYPYASSILTIRPSISLVVLLVLIPLASKTIMGKFRLSNAQTDLLLIRVSAALLTAGTLLLSVSEISSLAILSLIIFALGNGFTTLGKSLLTTFGPPEMAGTLLSAMNVSASLGAVIAGPIIAVMFDWGLEQGGIWVGSPLFFVTLLYALTLCSVIKKERKVYWALDRIPLTAHTLKTNTALCP